MGEGPARIDSPDVIREFRRRYVAFDQAVRNALMGVDTDIRSTAEWLRGEGLMQWRRRQRKCEEIMNTAQRALRQAQMNTDAGQKNSHVDEKKAYDKARRMKEEADHRVDLVKKWAVTLEQQASKLLGPVRAFGSRMDSLTPRALSRLDGMIVNLEQYLNDSAEEA